MVGLKAFSRRSLFFSLYFQGHQWYWQVQDAGVVERDILENYGPVARWNGPLGVSSAATVDQSGAKCILTS